MAFDRAGASRDPACIGEMLLEGPNRHENREKP